MIDDENIVGLLLDGPGNALSVLSSEQQRPENQKVKRALEMSRVFAIGSFSYRHSTQVCPDSGRMSTINPLTYLLPQAPLEVIVNANKPITPRIPATKP